MGRLSDFDPSKVEDRKYELIPDKTELLVIISESEERESKNNPGNFYENMKLQVVKGDYEGRTIYLRLNLCNKNPTAKTIADSQLKDIYRALNIEGADEFDELYDKPFWIRMKVKNDQNEIGAILWKKTNTQARAAEKSLKGMIRRRTEGEEKKIEFDSDDVPF